MSLFDVSSLIEFPCVVAQPFVPEPIQQYHQHQLQKQKSMQLTAEDGGKGAVHAASADAFVLDPRSSVLKAISALRYAGGGGFE